MHTQPSQDLFTVLLNHLPPIVARNQIERYLGGLISRGYLQNLDSEGKGPRRIKTGSRGRVGYLREDLIDWLKERSIIKDGAYSTQKSETP